MLTEKNGDNVSFTENKKTYQHLKQHMKGYKL
jgi:hypothetical protein